MTTCTQCGTSEEERLNTHASPMGRLCSECYDKFAAVGGWGPRLKSLRDLLSGPITVTVVTEEGSTTTHHERLDGKSN